MVWMYDYMFVGLNDMPLCINTSAGDILQQEYLMLGPRHDFNSFLRRSASSKQDQKTYTRREQRIIGRTPSRHVSPRHELQTALTADGGWG